MTKQIPKPVEFLLSLPLYLKISFAGMDAWDVVNVLYFDGTYDSYCPQCQRDSTFQTIAPSKSHEFVRNPRRETLFQQQGMTAELPPLKVGISIVHACCTRQKDHTQEFVFYISDGIVNDDKGLAHRTIEKIGQRPSYGDLHISLLKKYTHVLTSDQLAEFTRAIGLASHDVGVGAYVYLRRIFEALVEAAHQNARESDPWDEQIYQSSRMGERIALLRTHLPAFLVEHPGMYGLLSKGIHELSEEDCLKHFDTLRLGIELILDERLEKREQVIKVAAAKVALRKAIGDVGA